MRLTKRQLKRIIREEYARLKRRGLINEMARVPSDVRGVPTIGGNPHEACVRKCFAAIPGMMKQICQMGMAHTVTNDIYHICAPICARMGCDPDAVSEEVEAMCCGR